MLQKTPQAYIGYSDLLILSIQFYSHKVQSKKFPSKILSLIQFFSTHLILKKFPPEKSTQKQNYDTAARYYDTTVCY
jgi:hypothetical protein